MATDTTPPIFLVHTNGDPVVLTIVGRASYLNCAPVSQFFEKLVKQGRRRFVIDFTRCTGMDSTFLGLIAGAAMEAAKAQPPGVISLMGLSPRNLELVRNLGLHRLLCVDCGDYPMNFSPDQARALITPDQQELANARMILQAHENLVTADNANLGKFQDVLAFLKTQTEKEVIAAK
jgi:anti-anti-sigma regulatory factor